VDGEASEEEGKGAEGREEGEEEDNLRYRHSTETERRDSPRIRSMSYIGYRISDIH
jgi:hypothetical protein